MTHTDSILPGHLKKVSDEIGSLVFKPALSLLDIEAVDQESAQPAEASPLLLNPTMTIWKLKAETFAVLARTVPDGDIADWVEPTNLLYHQIRFNDELVASARSWSAPAESSALAQIGTATNFSARVDDAISFIEQENESTEFLKYDPVARLLEIPSHQVFGIWLYVEQRNESRVVVAQAPKEQVELPSRTLLTSEVLFHALHQYGPLTGIRDDS